MSYVNIRIAGTLTRGQKARIAAEITDTLERIALEPKSYTYISLTNCPRRTGRSPESCWTSPGAA